jgi:phage regulator Rha-like protein
MSDKGKTAFQELEKAVMNNDNEYENEKEQIKAIITAIKQLKTEANSMNETVDNAEKAIIKNINGNKKLSDEEK